MLWIFHPEDCSKDLTLLACLMSWISGSSPSYDECFAEPTSHACATSEWCLPACPSCPIDTRFLTPFLLLRTTTATSPIGQTAASFSQLSSSVPMIYARNRGYGRGAGCSQPLSVDNKDTTGKLAFNSSDNLSGGVVVGRKAQTYDSSAGCF